MWLVRKRRNLTWKRSEVLAWHIPLPDTVHFLFSSKMKPGYTAPMRKSSRRKQNNSHIQEKTVYLTEDVQNEHNSNTGSSGTQMKKVRRATLIRTQGTAQNINLSKDPGGGTVGAEAGL